jgi:hypothetical protein
MATHIVMEMPGGGGGSTGALVSDDFDTVYSELQAALQGDERFIVVTRADGDQAGKRFTIMAAGVISLRED